MNAEEIVKVTMAGGFDEAVVSTYRYAKAYLKIANSKIDSLVEKYEVSGSLFVSSKKRVFFTNMDSLDAVSVAKAIKNAKAGIAAIRPKEDYYGIAEGPFRYKNVPHGKSGNGIDKEEMYDMAQAAINSALENGATSVAGTVVAGQVLDELSTSKKVSESNMSPSFRLSLRVFAGASSAQDFIASKDRRKIEEESFAKNLTSLATITKKTGRISPGKYDIIYMPTAAGLLLSNVNSMACMGTVETGSPFAKKLGKQVGSRDVSIYDDGAIATGINSSPYDAEGYPSQRTAVIEGGVLKHYLHNHSTAIKYHTKSTGNAGLVQPGPNTMVLKHRKHRKSVEDLISDVDRGILVSNTWYTRFSNNLTGAFSTVPRDTAAYIECGEPKFMIKQIAASEAVGIRISDSIPGILKRMASTGGQTVQSTSWDSEGYYYFTPSILVRDTAVTTV